VYRLNKPSRPILCAVTDRSALSPAASPVSALLLKIAEAQSAGVDWIQIREKDLPGRILAALLNSAVAQSASAKGNLPRSKILVNDRLDVALLGQAAGVHVGENSLPVADVRRLVDAVRSSTDPPFLIGASCHSLLAARVAADSGANYLIFGPVFATPSKAQYGPPQGLDRLAEVCQAVDVPVLAIGGIDPQNAASCLEAGASGIAAIRLFQDAVDLPALVRALHALSLPKLS
jgi:thiamine-phosphate pyrophosphorylase